MAPHFVRCPRGGGAGLGAARRSGRWHAGKGHALRALLSLVVGEGGGEDEAELFLERRARKRLDEVGGGAGLDTAQDLVLPASALTSSTGTWRSCSSFLIAESSSKPPSVGISMSLITASTPPARRRSSAAAPLAASATSSSPISRSRPRTTRRMVMKSSTTRIRMAAFEVSAAPPRSALRPARRPRLRPGSAAASATGPRHRGS